MVDDLYPVVQTIGDRLVQVDLIAPSTVDNIEPGDRVGDLEFSDSEGVACSLDDFRDRSAIVFFFYPKDFSPGCTKEACAFRDYLQEIKDLGAEVFGVSGDSVVTLIDPAHHHGDHLALRPRQRRGLVHHLEIQTHRRP